MSCGQRCFADFRNLEQGNKKRNRLLIRQLRLVGMTGFEPATSSSRTTRATGLRYIPN
ncbi:MAG: hypothetical protein RLZ62_180, partial [Bacteroidota bacterium]